MKKFLTIFLVLFYCTLTRAQIEYPRYSVDSLGQKIVLLTIEQAIKLDNNMEVLALFEKMNAQISEYDSVCIKVVADKDKVIGSQKLEISKLKESLQNKDSQISTLQREISDYLVRISILEEQVENRNLVITEKDTQITGLRNKVIFGGIGGGVVIIGLTALLLLIN